MGNYTPSRLRRMGRNAFDPFINPIDVQPFPPGTWEYEYSLPHWLEGWAEARKAYELEQKEQDNICPCCGHKLN